MTKKKLESLLLTTKQPEWDRKKLQKIKLTDHKEKQDAESEKQNNHSYLPGLCSFYA